MFTFSFSITSKYVSVSSHDESCLLFVLMGGEAVLGSDQQVLRRRIRFPVAFFPRGHDLR